MSLTGKSAAALALHRFGLGPRVGSIDAIASDPRGALLAELDEPGAGQIADKTLISSSAAARVNFLFNQTRQAQQIAARMAAEEKAKAGGMMMEPKADDTAATGIVPEPTATKQPPEPNPTQRNITREVKARIDAAVNAKTGFVERLVWFWSNHFCVSADVVLSMAAGYEREAIRTHVLGKFGDMLLAVESHPAMLIYLDNFRSIGPMSVAGLVNKNGLNENLARETLELHTLGVRTVYTQDDVLRFAKVITGWTILSMANNPDHGNEFVFNPRLHEPGPQTVIGKEYAQDGVEQGKAVLADLARHPATARHIATKLARHFSADEPPPALVERLEKRFLDTDGDLKELAKALVEAPETWDERRVKLKRPSEWLIAMSRALGPSPDPRRSMDGQAYLGERLWRPVAPRGFQDVQSAWVDGLAQRLDIANRVAERVAARVEPNDFVETTLGPLASRDTRQAIARAESRQQALTLALRSPEFQRR